MSQSCVVLAGGLGTRLRSAVADLPKCLAPVGGRPFLDLQLEALGAHGFDHFVLSLGHMADAVEAAVQGFRVQARIDCVVEAHPLGTGGAVMHAMRETGLAEAAVVNGDTFIEADLAMMLQPLRRAEGELMRIAVIGIDDRARYGGVELRGTRVVSFVAKGRREPGLINAGLYRVHESAFAGYASGEAISMETVVMPALVAAGALHAAPLHGNFIDIGVPEDYRRFCDLHGGE